MSRLRKPSPALVVAIVALVASLGGVAIAAPTASDGTIRLCYSEAGLAADGTSAVELASPSHACANDTELPDTLVINQTGPRGQTGMAGPRGPQGLPGPAGPAGPATGGLNHHLTKQTLGKLGQVGKGANATEDKLSHARNQLLELIRQHGQIPPDVLARQQAHLEQVLAQLTRQMEQLNDVNRKVISKLGS